MPHRAIHLRLAACLVHAVPGASLLVTTASGDRVVVGHGAGAAVTPCAFRAIVAARPMAGRAPLVDVASAIDVGGALVDIGGGLYERAHPSGSSERWFVTTLPARAVERLATACPLPLPDGAVEVRVAADEALGACAVRLAAARDHGARLDEAAHWLHAACLVDELLAPHVDALHPSDGTAP